MPETEHKTTPPRVNIADFHVHAGQDHETLIDKAASRNLKVITWTGRGEIPSNTTQAVEYGQQKGVQVLPSVEYPARVLDGVTADLIAIGFNPKSAEIQEYFGRDEEKQTWINKQVARLQFDFLSSAGFDFEWLSEDDRREMDEMMAGNISDKAFRFCRIVATLPQNQSTLSQLKAAQHDSWNKIHQEYIDKPGYKTFPVLIDAKFLWYIYFRPGAPGYKSYESVITPSHRIIEAVHKADGIVLYSPEGKFSQDIYSKLVSDGIDGVMGWHGSRLELTKGQIRQIRHDELIILGGSDYDPEKNDWQIGSGSGSLWMSPGRLAEYLDKQSKRSQQARILSDPQTKL